MLFGKTKKRLVSIVAISIMSLSLASVITSIAWFASGSTIIPNVTSGIISSYFDSLDNPAPGAEPGSQGNPYVITRPIHYYNLVYLLEENYEGFDGSNTYFQFGKDLDDSGSAKFYSYNDNGIIIEGEYSTSLNMQYYNNIGMAGRELSPIGSASHPFNCNIIGNNLTVENLHITGKGKTDIGVFGYVGSNASISNLYFDNVTVDLNVTNVSEINASDHSTTHSTNINFGYLAGHVKQSNSFIDVYINNVSMTNSVNPLNAALRSDFGFFGKCDDVSIPQAGEPEFKHSWDSGDVYNYFDSNYGSISGQSFRARNTEYASSVSGTFSQAVTKNNDSYTFNSANGKNYSLATAGYQYDNQTYNVQYLDSAHSTYNFLTGSTLSNVAPNDQTEEGSYVYFDESVPSSKKWVYYNITKTGGQSIAKHYNAYTLSYKGVVTSGNVDTNTTYYLKYDANNGQLRSTTTAPISYENSPEYYFSFLTSKDSAGLSNIEDGFSTESYYLICCPKFDKYLYIDTAQETTSGAREYLSFGDYETSCQDGYTNRFTISGANNGTISYTSSNGEFYLVGNNVGGSSGDSEPKGGFPSGNVVKLSFTLNGSSHSSRQEESGHIYSKITSLNSIAAGDVIAFVAYSSKHSNYYAMSTQNSNNRSSVTVTPVNVNDYSTIQDSSEISQFRVSKESDLYSFYDIYNTTAGDGGPGGPGYLYNPNTSSKNYLRVRENNDDTKSKFNVSVKSSTNYTFDISNNSKYIYMNCNGTPLFSCYTSKNDETNYPSCMIYKRISQSVTIKGENAYDVVAETQSGEVITRTIHDIYYYDPTDITPNRQLLQIEKENIFEWNLTAMVTTITVPPHTVTGWVLVDSTAELDIGEQYIIAANAQGKVAKGFDTANGRMNSSNATFSGDKSLITNLSNGAYQFILGGNSSTGYTFSCDDGMLYGGKNGDTGFLNFTGLSGSNYWDISFDSYNNAIITCTDDYSIKYNSSYFGNYKTSSSTSIQLYKLVTTAPEYIGDKIGGGYSSHYIDTVGSVTYNASYMSLNNSIANTLTDAYIDSKFYNTEQVQNSMVVRIPNRGSLDYGTLELTTTGSGLPVFLNSGVSGPTVSMSDVSCQGQSVGGDTKYTLYLNKYNIYRLSYCTLDESGNINGAFDESGEELFMKDNSNISEFVLVIGLPGTSSTLNVKHLDITFPQIIGNIGDFGRVGFRSAPNTVPGEIFSFTYEFNSGVGNVNNAVEYDATNNAYYLTFTSSAATTLYIYNYDANVAKIYVNNVQYFGSYNRINILAS